MPDITVTVTISAKEDAMIGRRAAEQGVTKTVAAERILLFAIKQTTNGEIQGALDELREGQMTTESKSLLKTHIDSL